MKKILSILSMLAVCLLMASCQTDADKACSEMAKNMKDGKVDAVAKTAAELYSQKDDLSIDNLSDLAIAFHYLAQKESSEKTRPTFPTISRSRSTAIWLYIPTTPTRLRKFSKKRIRHNSATT